MKGAVIRHEVSLSALHLHLEQAELAESCDVAVEAYGRLERGVAFPRADTVLRLAAALECTTDESFGLVAQRANGDSNAVRLSSSTFRY